MNASAKPGLIPDPLPPGITLVNDYCSGPIFKGRAEDLIVAGLIWPEWIVDLGKLMRAIVLNADGSFTMPYPDGKRGSYHDEARARGLTTIKRAQSPDYLLVQRYRTKDEEREIVRRQRERYDREQQERGKGCPSIKARMVPVVPVVPKYRAEGNVIHFPRAAGGLEARP